MKKIVALILAICMLCTFTGCKSSDYKNAMELFENGNYSAALTLFEGLGDYKDSSEYLTKCKYNVALSEYENGNYSTALTIFESIINYKDSDEMVKKCSYTLGIEAFENEDYDTASAIFKSLGNYENSKDMYKSSQYKKLISYIIYKGFYSSTQDLYFFTEQASGNEDLYLLTDGNNVQYRYFASWETYNSDFFFGYECIYTLNNAPYYYLNYGDFELTRGIATGGEAAKLEGHIDVVTGKILDVKSQSLINVNIDYAKEMVVESQEDSLDFIKRIIKKSGVELTFEELFG